MSSFTFKNFKVDKRNIALVNIKRLKIKKKVKLVSLENTSLNLFLNKSIYSVYSNTNNSININQLFLTNKKYYLYCLILKNLILNNFFFYDNSVVFFNKNKLISTNFSCLISNERMILYIWPFKKTNKYFSISTLYSSSQWAEREINEFNNIFYVNLTDSRRLLTDYLMFNYSTINYKLTGYNLISQEINKRVLHWFFFFLFYIYIIIISFYFINFSLLHIIILSEILIILLILLACVLTVTYNIYWLLGLGLILLIFGGLELSLNLLLLSL